MFGGDELHTIKCNEWKNYDWFGGKRAIIKFDLRTKRSDFYDSASNFIFYFYFLFSGSFVISAVVLHCTAFLCQPNVEENVLPCDDDYKEIRIFLENKTSEKKTFFFILKFLSVIGRRKRYFSDWIY